MKYESDITLGEKYRDKNTGFEGVATNVVFFQHGCERVTLKTLDSSGKNIVDQNFDAPLLELVRGESNHKAGF